MSDEQTALNQVLGNPEGGKPEEPAPESVPAEGSDAGKEAEPEEPVEQPSATEKKEEPVEQPSATEKKEEPRQAVQKPGRRSRADDNVVFVGKKPTMSYVLAAVTQFSDGMDEIHIKARGKSISRAVDVAEVLRKRFIQGAKTDISIDTQEIADENRNTVKVSTIDIMLKR